MDRIFNPFERFSEHGPTQGSGMGLAICQKIVARHHGNISVFSGQGQGTTFQIILPEKQPLEESTPSFRPEQVEPAECVEASF